MIMLEFNTPPGSSNRFSIELRHGNKLVLYYYDTTATVYRPIALVDDAGEVSLPFLNKTGKVRKTRKDNAVLVEYPDFEFLSDNDVATALINKENNFTKRELDEIYLRSIASNFDKIKSFILPQRVK